MIAVYLRMLIVDAFSSPPAVALLLSFIVGALATAGRGPVYPGRMKLRFARWLLPPQPRRPYTDYRSPVPRGTAVQR